MKLLWSLVCSAVRSEALTVGVVGGGGRLGRRVVDRLLLEGHEVRSLRRSEARSPAGVTTIVGDVTNLESVIELLQNCSACIAVHGATRSKLSDLWTPSAEEELTHAKQVNYLGVANLLEAMNVTGCTRIVRVTGRGEKPWSIFSILINGFGSMAKAWNYEGETLLRRSGVDYTIVRPGVMTAAEEVSPSSEKRLLLLADNGEDLPVASISYEDVADLCVMSLGFEGTRRATLCAMTTTSATEGKETWQIDKVKPDSREFPPTLLREHLKAVRVGIPLLLFAVLTASFGLVKALLHSLFLKVLV